VNLAVALLKGAGVPRDPKRAMALLETASSAGSAQATLNLGVLADRGMTRKQSAYDYFKKAAELGEPRAYVRAAILLDEGRGIAKDPEGAADMVLTGVAADYGEAAQEIATNGAKWSAATRKNLQIKLKAAGYYDGPSDGKVSPKLVAALRDWRSKGGIDLSAAN